MEINGIEVPVKVVDRSKWAIALMRRGVIVKLNVSRWRATASLQKEDLGLKFADAAGVSFMHKYLVLGQEKLFPPAIISEVEAIENRARRILKDHSFETVWGAFVPYTAFIRWETANQQVKTDFLAAARRIGDHYPEIIEMVRIDYRNMAKDVWVRLYHDQGNPTESFIENFVSKIIAKIPSRQDVVTSFKYDATYMVLTMPSIIEEDISKAQDIASKREIQELEVNLEMEAKRRVSEYAISHKQEWIDSFLSDTVAAMRKNIAELCDSVLQSMLAQNSSNDITKPQQKRIKKMIEKVQMLNFHNDNEINELLSGLDTEISRFKGERNKNTIVEKLQKIVMAGSNEFYPDDFNPAISTLEV